MKLLLLFISLNTAWTVSLVAQNFSAGIRFGTVEAFEITEASGLVASRQNPGVMWVHNDNHYVGTMFALSTNGALLGSYVVPGVFSGDIEDIAIGPGPLPDFHYLYLGDIGDNTASRESIRIYRVPEPAVYTNSAALPWYRTAAGADVLTLRYPDGPFNAEALMVDPLTGDLFIATKLTNSCRIYQATRAQLDGGGPITLSFVREIGFFKVSGGDISFDGRLVTLRRGGTVGMWTRSATQSVGDALGGTGKSAPVATEENGEAIGFHPTGLGYFTLSEGYGQTNYFYRRTDSGVPRQPVVMIPSGAVWRYEDTGTDLGTAWRATNYNDSGWGIGPAQLGYGQGDEATVVWYGPDDFEKNPTTYFRKRFNLTSTMLNGVTNLALRVCFNDGAAVYLNGVEVFRRNIATNAAFADAAGGSGGEYQNIWQSVSVSPALVRVGTNTVAVELHRYQGWEPDLSFDLQLLEGTVERPVRFVEPPRQVGTNWQIRLSGPVGALGVVEGSQDMASWSKVGEVVLTTGQGTVLDPVSPTADARRFYRVKR
jgi:hypothetical protein